MGHEESIAYKWLMTFGAVCWTGFYLTRELSGFFYPSLYSGIHVESSKSFQICYLMYECIIRSIVPGFLLPELHIEPLSL